MPVHIYQSPAPEKTKFILKRHEESFDLKLDILSSSLKDNEEIQNLLNERIQKEISIMKKDLPSFDASFKWAGYTLKQ